MKQFDQITAASGALETAFAYGQGYRDRTRPLNATADANELRRAFGGALPEHGQGGASVISDLIKAAEPGLIGNTEPGFFGWVMGASHPTGVAADWLAAIWGQNAGIYQTSPAAAIAEEVAADWIVDLLDLPRESSVGFTTGATMAGFIALAAARGEVLRQTGHDIDLDGFQGAPRITVFVSDDTHVSNLAALRYLGFGTRDLVKAPSDSQGRILVPAMAKQMAQIEGPKIIVATAGHINSGAFDDFHGLADLALRHDAWLHIDSAFGLWARANPSTRNRTQGIERADSWSTDGHKWVQIPYDAGFAIVRNRDAHRRAMDISATYLTETSDDGRNATHYSPELSRRARGFAVWATLRSLGSGGVAELINRHCNCAERLAQQLSSMPGVEICNDVVLNQVVLSFSRFEDDPLSGELTQAMEAALNADGKNFFRTAVWKGRRILRISISSRLTGPAEIDMLTQKIRSLWAEVEEAHSVTS
ncbi:MAG: pyridoxal-dependent decarboxylase [Paracoccaceae bacterium]